MAQFGNYDRDQEERDIEREGVPAVGQPQKLGGLLSQFKAKFADLDKDRYRTFAVKAKNGETFWAEFDLDLTEEELREARQKAEVGNRAARRQGRSDINWVVMGGELLNSKNTRVWAVDPEKGGEPLEDDEGDPITFHSQEWCELLNHPGDPIGALRYLFGDFWLQDLFNNYTEAAGVGEDGVTMVDPTRA